MIDISRYNKLKEKYGNTSSWTIWKEVGSTPKSNTADMSIFDDKNICNKLNDKYVFIALNGSSTHGKQEETPWKNFHSSYKYQHDYKLRYALVDTKFWGSYITDIIKEFPEVDSSKVETFLKNNPQVIEDNINIFENELNILSDKKPILIAIGNDSYDILKNYLNEKYIIIKIKHYSYYIGQEKYRKEVLSILNNNIYSKNE